MLLSYHHFASIPRVWKKPTGYITDFTNTKNTNGEWALPWEAIIHNSSNLQSLSQRSPLVAQYCDNNRYITKTWTTITIQRNNKLEIGKERTIETLNPWKRLLGMWGQ
jgi:hypothetical protein